MPEKKIKKGAPPWMATFADLSTLLMTFFVLLLSFSNMDVQKFRDMLGSVQQAFGVQFQVHGQFQPVAVDTDRNRPSAPTQEEAQPDQTMERRRVDLARSAAEASRMSRQIRDLVESSGMGEMVDVQAGRQGVRLRVKGQLLFDAGSSEVKPSAHGLLDGIVKVMDKFKFYLVVEGHTDSVPISTSQFPSNWELSGARASAVLRYLVGKGVSESRVSAIGYASNYPIASNASQAGRNKNRRVEFIFTKRPPRVGVE